LEEYIAKRLVDDKAVAKLFEGFGPLSTFSAKIEFAFALGLLPKHVHTDLRTIRKVRNLFAHEPDSSNFLTNSIKDLCATLWRVPRSDGSVSIVAPWNANLRISLAARRSSRASSQSARA
jgi:DNA-binding MltR family transcriptional regulator